MTWLDRDAVKGRFLEGQANLPPTWVRDQGMDQEKCVCVRDGMDTCEVFCWVLLLVVGVFP